MEKLVCIWDDFVNPNNGLNLVLNYIQYHNVLLTFRKKTKKN